jgi:hypothetical protein
VPSVSRQAQLAVLALCTALLVGGLTGCETTQEKAAAKQAESAQILKARGQRQRARQHHREHHTHHADGPKTLPYRAKSARRREGE